MDEYCEENAKCYAEETFSIALPEQYQRVCPFVKRGGKDIWRGERQRA